MIWILMHTSPFLRCRALKLLGGSAMPAGSSFKLAQFFDAWFHIDMDRLPTTLKVIFEA